MAGTREGGLKAMATSKQRYGDNFPEVIGAAGGRKSTGGGFAKNKLLAQEAGRKGGSASRRRPDYKIEADRVREAQAARGARWYNRFL